MCFRVKRGTAFLYMSSSLSAGVLIILGLCTVVHQNKSWWCLIFENEEIKTAINISLAILQLCQNYYYIIFLKYTFYFILLWIKCYSSNIVLFCFYLYFYLVLIKIIHLSEVYQKIPPQIMLPNQKHRKKSKGITSANLTHFLYESGYFHPSKWLYYLEGWLRMENDVQVPKNRQQVIVYLT